MAENPLKDYEKSPQEIRKNVILQSWKTHSNADASKTVQELLKTAKTFKVRPEGLFFNPEIRKAMPIWHHREADPKIRRQLHNPISKCLRTNH